VGANDEKEDEDKEVNRGRESHASQALKEVPKPHDAEELEDFQKGKELRVCLA
jgi:hypothetical protein